MGFFLGRDVGPAILAALLGAGGRKGLPLQECFAGARTTLFNMRCG